MPFPIRATTSCFINNVDVDKDGGFKFHWIDKLDDMVNLYLASKTWQAEYSRVSEIEHDEQIQSSKKRDEKFGYFLLGNQKAEPS